MDALEEVGEGDAPVLGRRRRPVCRPSDVVPLRELPRGLHGVLGHLLPRLRVALHQALGQRRRRVRPVDLEVALDDAGQHVLATTTTAATALGGVLAHALVAGEGVAVVAGDLVLEDELLDGRLTLADGGKACDEVL